ncbi:MAG: cation diffusion facilitator family transporter, partial [bacterium]
MSQGADTFKSVIYALSANVAIAVAKFFAAFYTGSGAMLAEAIHSTADSGNQLLLLLGMKQSRRPATEEYPLGFGKSVYFWSFVVAIILFSVGGLFSAFEGWHKLNHPQPLQTPWIAIGVLVFAIFAEGASFYGCIREVNKVRKGRSYWRWFRESRQSALIVIFGEDFAALMGLFLALAAIVATLITGNPLYDALGTMAIGALLIIVAWFIGTEIKDLLIGQSANPILRKEINDFLDNRDEIQFTYHVITLQLGDEIMVSVKANMKEAENATQLINDINQVEAA